MISIIISTYKPDNFKAVSKSIAETIGTEYEIIGIENHLQYSICEAYNKGCIEAKFPYICFMHDDIVFYSQGWGKRLISLLENDITIGLVGIAGSKFKSTYPNTGWGNGPYLKKFNRGCLFTDISQKEPVDFDIRTYKTQIDDVVVLDGLFLFTRKSIADRYKFDEKLLNHFHAYDADFSLQIFFAGYRVIIDRSISLIHYSKGVFAKDFAFENTKVVNKWKSKLPVASRDLDLNIIKLHYYNIKCWSGYIQNWIIRKISF